jgi:hypothetical protein
MKMDKEPAIADYGAARPAFGERRGDKSAVALAGRGNNSGAFQNTFAPVFRFLAKKVPLNSAFFRLIPYFRIARIQAVSANSKRFKVI